ncbi:potassium transporter Kef, partial [Halorubrum sp. E3]
MEGRCTYRFDPDEYDATGMADTGIDEVWHCPHDAHAGADRCVFHLSSDARDELGVDDDAVADRLRKVAGERGKDAKCLLGASLDDLSIRHEIVEAADKHPLDLRGATVTGTLDLSESEFEGRIDLSGAEIGAIDWTESEFDASVDLSGAVVRGETTLTAAVFEGDVDLVGTTFEGPVDAREVRFNGDTTLRETRFHDAATFDGAEFRGDANLLDDDACFEDARFDAPVSFTEAAFRYADFVGCEFRDDAAFDRATFGGDAEFADATF